MIIDNRSNEPIFMQIAYQIEEQIIAGKYLSDKQIPSTAELSELLTINPHTILKGMNILVDEGILYKKRGIGLFVEKDARLRIVNKRRDQFTNNTILEIVNEAKKLDISKDEILTLIERSFNDDQNNESK
ncbi:MAG: GntR family transcriptional regulator [Erysipelothrix sp.]|nr:GntR family transcriptional regulator [Erysipelothrix sp.]